jgi:ribosomal protein L12E/L44/L45/RPP1/RPP2
MEGCCSTGQSPQWAVVPMEEEEKEEKEEEDDEEEEEEDFGVCV